MKFDIKIIVDFKSQKTDVYKIYTHVKSEFTTSSLLLMQGLSTDGDFAPQGDIWQFGDTSGFHNRRLRMGATCI